MDRQSLWNWTKAALGLREVRGALQVLVSHHFNTFYESLPCSQSNSSCTSKHRTILPVHSDGYTCYKKKCTCKTSEGEHCPVCSYTYGMIVEEMSNSSQMPALNNCKTEKWSTNQWEVAKAFIVGSGYKDIDSAKRTDVSAIIGICMNASCIRKYLQQKDLDAFQKVREIRNMIFHSCDLNLQEKEMKDSLQSMFDMLDDNLESNKLIKEAFTTAKQKLKKLPEEPLCEHCIERIDCSRDALAALEADTKQLLNELEQSQPENNQDIQDKLMKLLESQNVHFSRISVEEQKMDNTLVIVSSVSVQMESSVRLRKEIADQFKRQGLTMEPSLQTVLNHGVKVYRPKYSHVNSENIKTKYEDDKVMVAVSEQNETKNEDDTVMVQLSAEQKLPQEMASIKDTVTDMQTKERENIKTKNEDDKVMVAVSADNKQMRQEVATINATVTDLQKKERENIKTKNEDDKVMVAVSADNKQMRQEVATINATVTDLQKKERENIKTKNEDDKVMVAVSADNKQMRQEVATINATVTDLQKKERENIKTKNEDDKVMVAVSADNKQMRQEVATINATVTDLQKKERENIKTKNEDDKVMVAVSADNKQMRQEVATINATVTDLQKKERENIKTKNEDDKVMVAVSADNKQMRQEVATINATVTDLQKKERENIKTKNEDDKVMVAVLVNIKQMGQEMATIKVTVTDLQKKERDQEQRLGKLTKPHIDVLERWIGTGPKRFQLLYSITRDGCVGERFHRICDNKGPTVQVLYNLNGCIYGGYTSISWASDDTFKPDDNAFLFQLMFKGISRQNKFPVKKGSQCATFNRITYGPTYGLSHDFRCFQDNIQPSNGVFKLNGHMWHVGIDYETNGLTAYEINDNSLDVTELEVYTVTDLV